MWQLLSLIVYFVGFYTVLLSAFRWLSSQEDEKGCPHLHNEIRDYLREEHKKNGSTK